MALVKVTFSEQKTLDFCRSLYEVLGIDNPDNDPVTLRRVGIPSGFLWDETQQYSINELRAYGPSDRTSFKGDIYFGLDVSGAVGQVAYCWDIATWYTWSETHWLDYTSRPQVQAQGKYSSVYWDTDGPDILWIWFKKLETMGLATITGGATMPDTYNKVIINGTTYIDLSDDDVTAAQVLDTVTAFHDKNGAILPGSIQSKAAATYNTSSSNQTINAGQYLSGAQTIRGVTTSGISAANIKQGVVIKVGDSADDDRITTATGTYTSDATITMTGSSGSKTSSELLTGKTAYAKGEKVTGAMANNGSNNVVVSSVAGTTIPTGFYNGGGIAVIDSASAAELADGSYILTGHTILGVPGTLVPGSAVTHSAVNVAPKFTSQTVAPADFSVQFFDTITVAAIVPSITDTGGGTTGKTVTISNGANPSVPN